MATNTTSLTEMTIEEYLQGKVGFSVEVSQINPILFDRKVESGALVRDLSVKERELCTADLFMLWYSSSPSTSGSVKDADGNWSHEEGGSTYSRADKQHLYAEAQRIYKKYGEYVPAERSSIKLKSGGMRLWRK